MMRRALPRRPRFLLLTAFAAALLALSVAAPGALADAFTPESGGSPNADDIDTLYKITLYVAIVIFIGVEGALIWSLVKYRARRDGAPPAQIRGNTPLELGWTIGAALILVVLTAVTFVYLGDIENPPPSGARGLQASNAEYASIDQSAPPKGPGDAKPLTIRVNGQQYLWRYDYPGAKQLFSYYTMVVPTDTTIVLDITASDVIHSWWIPKLGGKMDGVPGHVNETWFKIPAGREGTYRGQCAELCGYNHADMRAEVRAVTPAEYERWADRQRQGIEDAKQDLANQRKAREQSGEGAVVEAGTAARRTRAGVPEVVMHGWRERPRGWLEWLTTTDHKKIGIMYLFATFLFFIVGGVEALVMRLQLAQPNGTLVDPEAYNGLVTVHGTTMIFLFLVPVLAGFGNYLVPLMIGARDMAFPRLNALSFWLLLFGGIAFYASFFFEPPQAGWTMYPPLSDDAFSAGGGVDAWIFLIHLTGLSSLVGAINFVATIHNMRAPGMSWGRMPLFVWTILVYSYLLIAALPAIAAARDDAADRPPLRHRLLRPHRRRRPAAVAAPVLVLRAPRGLHHDPAGLRDDLGDPARVRPQADLRLQGDRGVHGGDRLPRPARVGAPHVHHARRPPSCWRSSCSRRSRSPCPRASRSSTGSRRSGAARSSSRRRCCSRSRCPPCS